MGSNLPPGVTESQLPGNTPEDAAWDKVYDQILEDAANNCFDAETVGNVWRIGLAAYNAFRPDLIEQLRAEREFVVEEVSRYIDDHPESNAEEILKFVRDLCPGTDSK